jgi:hypothetical protein
MLVHENDHDTKTICRTFYSFYFVDKPNVENTKHLTLAVRKIIEVCSTLKIFHEKERKMARVTSLSDPDYIYISLNQSYLNN